MTQDFLPSVLVPPKPNSGISMERALKQIKDLLEHYKTEYEIEEDRVNASIDDIEVMLLSIK